MSDQVVDVGDKLHIITRRLFEQDLRRHFVGEVAEATGPLVALRGYTFIFEPGPNLYKRLPGARTRILSLADASFLVTRIPQEARIEALTYKVVDDRVVISDGESFSMPISEFGSMR